MVDVPLLSVSEAAARGIRYLRKPIWASRFDHLKIDIIDGQPGPLLHIYSPFNKECNGRDPVDILGFDEQYNDRCFVPHTGPLADSDEYQAEVARFDGVMARQIHLEDDRHAQELVAALKAYRERE